MGARRGMGWVEGLLWGHMGFARKERYILGSWLREV